MRIRSIKPEFYRSEDIAALDWETRLVFIGLWSYVDDNGVGRDVEKLITADLFALEGDPTEVLRRVSRSLKVLSKGGQIVRYRADGRPFLFVANWDKHQLVKNPNKPRYPRPDAEVGAITEHVPESYGDSTEGVGTGTGEQGNRGTGVKNSSAPAVLDVFDDCWAHWPKKVERKKALEQWRVAAKKIGADNLADAVTRFGDAYAASTERQFVPALGVWLRGERWTDDLPSAPVDSRLVQKPTAIAVRDGQCVHRFVGGWCAECSEREP